MLSTAEYFRTRSQAGANWTGVTSSGLPRALIESWTDRMCSSTGTFTKFSLHSSNTNSSKTLADRHKCILGLKIRNPDGG